MSSLTDIRHLGDIGAVDGLRELGLIVIDVVNLDNKLSGWFQWEACVFVESLCLKGVGCFFFSVESLSGVKITCLFIDTENGACSFSREDVASCAISSILVRAKLEEHRKTDVLCTY